MAATVVPGDFVCCEIDSQQEPWMIGLAETGLIKYEGGEQITWMGRIMAGDLLIWATKLEGSGNIFGATEKRVPIFAEAVTAATTSLGLFIHPQGVFPIML